MLCYFDDASAIEDPVLRDGVRRRSHLLGPSTAGTAGRAARRGLPRHDSVVAALHRTNPPAGGLADFGRRGNFFERHIGRWTRGSTRQRPPSRCRRWTG